MKTFLDNLSFYALSFVVSSLIILPIFGGIYWSNTNFINKQKRFIKKVMAENNISYDTTKSFTTLDYEVLVREGEKEGERKFKITDRYSERTYYFILDRENNIRL